MTRTDNAKYSYQLTIDIAKIIDEIKNLIPGDILDSECEDDRIIIYASDSCKAKSTYFPQTYDSPAEYDCDLIGSVDNVDVEKIVRDAFSNTLNISVCAEIEEDSIELEEDYGPDPDMMPGGWDTRFDD